MTHLWPKHLIFVTCQIRWKANSSPPRIKQKLTWAVYGSLRRHRELEGSDSMAPSSVRKTWIHDRESGIRYAMLTWEGDSVDIINMAPWTSIDVVYCLMVSGPVIALWAVHTSPKLQGYKARLDIVSSQIMVIFVFKRCNSCSWNKGRMTITV